MLSHHEIVEQCRVPHDRPIRLEDYDPAWEGDPEVPKAERMKRAERVLAENICNLADAQDLLWASDSWAILVVLQAMDTAGKDGIIKHVLSGVNPLGCQVTNFKQPTPEELDHDFLWRYARALPERGRIGIFNRSYYEEVLVVRVHPELLRNQRIPGLKAGAAVWADRFEEINAFERHLTRNGTVVLKFFLHISKDEQRRRLLKRIEDPAKHWKFSPQDVIERGYWGDYQDAYEEAISATSTKHAPWYIIPSDHKWVSRALVGTILADTIRSLDLRFPEVMPERLKQIEEANRLLKSEE